MTAGLQSPRRPLIPAQEMQDVIGKFAPDPEQRGKMADFRWINKPLRECCPR